MKNGLNMAVSGAALGHLHSFGRKLVGLIKSNQNLEHFNDNKGKNSLTIQCENNWAAEGNHWAANWLAQASAKHCWVSHPLLQESGSTFGVWLWLLPYTASEWLCCSHCPKCPHAQGWEFRTGKQQQEHDKGHPLAQLLLTWEISRMVTTCGRQRLSQHIIPGMGLSGTSDLHVPAQCRAERAAC